MLEIAAAIASMGYTGWKLYLIIQKIFSSKEKLKWDVITQVISAAVQSVYDDFIGEEKKLGKLSKASKKKAKESAYNKVIEGCLEHGIDISKNLTPAEILDYIEETVSHNRNTRKK